MAKKLPRARESISQTGTSDVLVAGQVSPSQSLIAAGAVDGDYLDLVIEDDNGNWEYDKYLVSIASPAQVLLVRSGNPIASSNSGSRINLSGSAKVFSDLFAENIYGNKKIAPSQITSNQNDYAPTGYKACGTIEINSDAARNVTGLQNVGEGEVRELYNSGSFSITLVNASASSIAANRFGFGADVVLKPGDSLTIRHNGTNWKLLSSARKSIITAGSIGSSSSIPTVTYDDEGRITAVSGNTITAAKPADQQVFTSSGTWTKPSGFGAKAYVLIECWGGGGGGSRSNALGGLSGGGGGAYKYRRILLSSLGATETVTIGAGGTGRTGSTGSGTNGGDTTFGSWVAAYGGSGGLTSGTSPGGGSFVPAGQQIFSGKLDAVLPYDGGSGANGGTPAAAPGNAVYGGAGGGGAASGVAMTGGTSQFGGSGGNAGNPPTAGAQPGGGGGGGGGTNIDGANGGAGKCVVTVFDGA